jgi:hypothetical protein
MKRIFSISIITVTALYIAWFFMPMLWESIYDYETLGGLQWNGFGAKINMDGPIPYVSGVLYLASAAGLLLYQSWARTLFLLLAIANILAAPFMGVFAVGGYDAMIGNIITLLDGAILAMAYLTSLSIDFRKNA